MVWAYMSAKSSSSRSWIRASWKAFISLRSGPLLGFDGQCRR